MAEKADLSLSIGEFVYLQTTSTGAFTTHVGPAYVTASENHRYMVPDAHGRLTAITSERAKEQAIQQTIKANRNQYVILNNPATAEGKAHPSVGKANEDVSLQHGEVEIIPGPCTFALWPGQTATVVNAHTLRTGQYLVIEVVNEAEARANWNDETMGTAPWLLGQEVKAENVIDTTKPDSEKDEGEGGKADAKAKPETATTSSVDGRIQGKQYIITGRDISFFIPATGIEVVKDSRNQYVREALVLQQLEYCVLVSETGEKTVVRGPGIVFPRNAGENFYSYQGTTTFRPIELGKKRMGIYVKALVDFKDETGRDWKAGQEGFITGEDMPFFYPDERLDIIQYGDKLVLYAVTVEAGKAYYLLNRDSGAITLVEGPDMLLPNPVEQVFIERQLTAMQKHLWFPGSNPGTTVRDQLRGGSDSFRYSEENEEFGIRRGQPSDTTPMNAVRKGGFEALVAFSTLRDSQFSEPRVITIGNEVPQAPRIDVWQNYAVLVKNAANKTRLVVGPQTTFLQYDEELVSFVKPGETALDVYLQVHNNSWTFNIQGTTSDGVEVVLKLVAEVNFTGEANAQWWKVANPYQLVQERFQSQLVPYIAAHQLETLVTPKGNTEMLSQVITIQEEATEQTPINFGVNGMQVTRVYVSDFEVADHRVSTQLANHRLKMVELDMQHAAATEEAETVTKIAALTEAIIAQRKAILTQETALSEEEARAAQKVQDIIAELNRERQKKQALLDKEIAEGENALEIQLLESRTQALVQRLQAIAPHDSAYLRQIVGGQLLNQFADTFGGSAQRAGVPLMQYVSSILKGTQFEGLIGLFEMPEIDGSDED